MHLSKLFQIFFTAFFILFSTQVLAGKPMISEIIVSPVGDMDIDGDLIVEADVVRLSVLGKGFLGTKGQPPYISVGHNQKALLEGDATENELNILASLTDGDYLILVSTNKSFITSKTAFYDLTIGAVGPQGEKGDAGDVGPQGPPGTSILQDIRIIQKENVWLVNCAIGYKSIGGGAVCCNTGACGVQYLGASGPTLNGWTAMCYKILPRTINLEHDHGGGVFVANSLDEDVVYGLQKETSAPSFIYAICVKE